MGRPICFKRRLEEESQRNWEGIELNASENFVCIVVICDGSTL